MNAVKKSVCLFINFGIGYTQKVQTWFPNGLQGKALSAPFWAILFICSTPYLVEEMMQ